MRPADALGVIEVSLVRFGEDPCKAYIEDNFLMSLSFKELVQGRADIDLPVIHGIAHDLEAVR